MNAFAKMFRKYRVEGEITLREISEKIGKSIGFWSDVEHGRRLPPNSELVNKLENLLGIEEGRLSKLAEVIRETPSDFNYLIKNNPQVADIARTLLRAENEMTEEELRIKLQKVQNIISGKEDE